MEQDRPSWDDELARGYLGRTIIVGITRLDADGELVSQRQFHGTVEQADAKSGIGIRVAGDGSLYWLPPDLRSIQVAPRGDYRIRSTGEVVTNPELMTTWTIDEPRRDRDHP